MAVGDNFMWFPGADICGETTDELFSQRDAFEIISFDLSLTCSETKAPESDKNIPTPPPLPNWTKVNKDAPAPPPPPPKSKLAGGPAKSSPGGGSAGTAVAGKVTFNGITIVKVVDRASVSLYQACSKGTIIDTAMIGIRKAGGEPVLYLQYIFRYNQITDIKWKGGTGTERPQEEFTLTYKGLGMQYIQQKADGQVMAGKPWSWNIVRQDEDKGRGTSNLEIAGLSPPPRFLPGLDYRK